MDEYAQKKLTSYTKSALKYKNSNHPLRLKWFGQTKEEMAQLYKEIANLIPSHIKSILEPSIGCGHLAKAILKIHPNIQYRGFDIVEQNVLDSKKLLPDIDIWNDNYWNVLSQKPTWDFIISNGVLFSCTAKDQRSLLFDLLDAASPKGFLVTCLRGQELGLSTGFLHEKMQQCINNSIDVIDYYYKGKRDFLSSDVLKWYFTIFFIFREGTKAKMPDVPEELISEFVPESLDKGFGL
jgi:hypothetical protein